MRFAVCATLIVLATICHCSVTDSSKDAGKRINATKAESKKIHRVEEMPNVTIRTPQSKHKAYTPSPLDLTSKSLYSFVLVYKFKISLEDNKTVPTVNHKVSIREILDDEDEEIPFSVTEASRDVLANNNTDSSSVTENPTKKMKIQNVPTPTPGFILNKDHTASTKIDIDTTTVANLANQIVDKLNKCKTEVLGTTAKVVTTKPEFEETIVDPENAPKAAQTDLNHLTYADHKFYRSAFIGNEKYFKEHWESIFRTHSESEQDSFMLRMGLYDTIYAPLNFNFTFYGRSFDSVVVSPQGFVSISDYPPRTLAGTQYAAPLLAPFNVTLCKGCSVKIYEYADNVTAVWENVSTKEERNDKFTFAITLHRNGDMTFAYKDVPKPPSAIKSERPIVIGLSDAFINKYKDFNQETVASFTVYNMISLEGFNVTSNTLIKLLRQPTCVEHTDCESCTKAAQDCGCSWCPVIRQCSGGVDSNYGRFTRWSCYRRSVVTPSQCTAATLEKYDHVAGLDPDLWY